MTLPTIINTVYNSGLHPVLEGEKTFQRTLMGQMTKLKLEW